MSKTLSPCFSATSYGKKSISAKCGTNQGLRFQIDFLGSDALYSSFSKHCGSAWGVLQTIPLLGRQALESDSAKCNASPQGCYREASKTCQGSYQVLDSESHAGGLLA